MLVSPLVQAFPFKPAACKVSVVECWQLKPNEDDDEQADGSSKGTPAHNSSILDKKAQDKNFMDIAGVGSNHSAGLRPEAPIED